MARVQTLDRDAAFDVIQSALETFNAEIGKARAGQAESEETIAAVEYELNEMRKLIAETMLPRPNESARAEQPLNIQLSGEKADGGLLKRLAERAA
ncbi:hypothetical protein [Hyphomicrobium sp. CS1GBMeth3]|uniref:hypothetical protein n=1 Tax=Hyphomicrobium sp. CS1GBMeth3 TaxID=1892845 RepID=UPI000930851F|nr:hypothetical protein [Hyphomicrobium sp. CS1GBMeth3]